MAAPRPSQPRRSTGREAALRLPTWRLGEGARGGRPSLSLWGRQTGWGIVGARRRPLFERRETRAAPPS
eukprot:4894785-Lingulodinium_polyedra.AAC.1